MIVITGGAGFIGSALLWKLNQEGIEDIVVADHMGHENKWKNLAKARFSELIHKDQIWEWLEQVSDHSKIEAIFHMGASSSTTETDVDYLVDNNINFSVSLWRFCTHYKIPFIYASSAATYGDGQHGFVDDEKTHRKVVPLNPYGFSKHRFDEWVFQQKEAPPFWAGMKFFNVYGPNEYHKGKQTSVIYQLVPQVQKTGSIKLFKSDRPDVGDGEQSRDFVYVRDCVNLMWHLFKNQPKSGIYNCGTGKARTFADLARAVFAALGKEENIEFIEMPDALKGQYQYYTEANLDRVNKVAGYDTGFTELEEGVREYVQNFLTSEDPYL
jgi:ADP-L-glycero-D-manno-heptose 6-epimerase